MPPAQSDDAPRKPNWELARVLYFQGVKSSIILEECNLTRDQLRNRIYREKWQQQRLNLKAKVTQVSNPANGITLPSVTEMGKTVRQLAAAGLLKASEGLDSVKKPKGLKQVKELAETVKAITDPAGKVFAWEEQKPTVLIDLGTLKSARRIEAIEIPSQVVAPESNPPKLITPPESTSKSENPPAVS